MQITLNPEYTKAVQGIFCGLKIWKVKIIAHIAHCEYEAFSRSQGYESICYIDIFSYT